MTRRGAEEGALWPPPMVQPGAGRSALGRAVARSRRPLQATAAELALFRDALGDVTPLHPPPAPAAPSSKAIPSPPPPRPVVPVAPAVPFPKKSKPVALPLPPDFAIGREATGTPPPLSSPPTMLVRPGERSRAPVPGLDRRTQDRHRRGQREIEGRIDLHGLDVARARDVVTAWLITSAQHGRRSLLVITGKGRLFDEDSGKIRRAFAGWLAEAPLARHVLSVQPAQLKDGGDGAWYVLLRRQR